MSKIPPTPYYSRQFTQEPGPNGLAIASLVCGIVSLVLFCIWHVAVPCALAAIILGFIAKSKIRRGEASGGGMATAGIVCGGVALLLALLIIAGIAALVFGLKSSTGQNWIQHSLQNQMQYFQQMHPHPTTAPTSVPTTAP